MRTLLRGVNKFAQNGAPQSRRQTEQWQMLDETIASASINEIRVLPQKHSPGVGGLSNAIVVVSRQSRALQACRIQQSDAAQPRYECWEYARLFPIDARRYLLAQRQSVLQASVLRPLARLACRKPKLRTP